MSAPLVAALLTLTGVVHAWGMGRAPGLTDDEGTYVAQAWAVLTRGSLSHYTYWYDHPPLGWVQIAGWVGLTGGFHANTLAVVSGRGLALLAALVSAGQVFLLGRRLGFTRTTAAVAVLVFALCPLALSQQRLVLLDNLAVPWLLGALVLAASPARRLWAFAASGMCFAVAVLTKETFLLLLPAVVWLVWERSDRRTRRFCLTAFFAAFVLLVTFYPLFALLKGELWPSAGRVSLFDALRFQLFTRPSSGSVLTSGTPARALLDSWLASDPWLLGAAALALPAGLALRRLRPIAVGLAVMAVFLLRGGYLPGPYVLVALPLAAVLVAGVGEALWRWPRSASGRAGPALTGRRLGRAAVVSALVVAGALVAPRWFQADHRLMTADHVTPVRRAEAWLAGRVPHRATMIIDDSVWVDLVDRGFDPNRIVWFQKLDFTQNIDPSITRRFPQGWRAFDYVVETPVLRGTLSSFPGQMTDLRTALAHSRVVASFGRGPDRVDVRRIEPPGPGGASA